MVEKYDFNKDVLFIFDLIKNETYRENDFNLPIYKDGKCVAILRPITKRNLIDNEKNREIIKLLSKWREESSKWFDIFKVTESGTKKWLKEQVIDIKNRILFMIETFDGTYIGHIGLYRGEIDNIIRGRKDILKGLMTYAINTMVKWAFSELNIDCLYVRVFSDNEKAIALYKRCGFNNIDKIPLRKIVKKESIRWEPIEETNIKEADRFFSLMYLKNKNISD